MKEKMLEYLQELLDTVKEEESYYNESKSERDKRRYERAIDKMLACKEMVEVLIEEPVNCGLDGKVTVGF